MKFDRDLKWMRRLHWLSAAVMGAVAVHWVRTHDWLQLGIVAVWIGIMFVQAHACWIQQRTRHMVREVMPMLKEQAAAKAAYDRGFADGLRDLYESRREQIN